jgi:Ser/Thr protein kinase RdoA (MazF antagonist)
MSEEIVLEQVLSCYGLANARTRLLQRLWNETYFVEATDGKRYNLRICSPLLQDKNVLEDELYWLEYVSQRTQTLVPRPIANVQGELLTSVDTEEGNRFSCLFEWIEGEDALKCLSMPVMYQIGQSVATLHQIAKGFAFPAERKDFRRDYCYERTLAASHHGWMEVHRQEIGAENYKLLEAAIDWLLAGFERIGETRENFGFIHADLHLGNFLVHDGQVSVIDFDQLGRGHYLYDIATLMVELYDYEGQFPSLWNSFQQGYQTVADLPFRQESELGIFIVAVRLVFLDWVYNSQEPNVRKTKMPLVPAVYNSIRNVMLLT